MVVATNDATLATCSFKHLTCTSSKHDSNNPAVEAVPQVAEEAGKLKTKKTRKMHMCPILVLKQLRTACPSMTISHAPKWWW